MEQTLKGIVVARIYTNEQSGYGIFQIVLFNSDQKALTIKGPIAELEVDSSYDFEGYYHEDDRYGLQFTITNYRKTVPNDRDFIIRYLSGPAFPGVGAKTAEAIVDAYGDSVLEDIKARQLNEISVGGVSKDKAKQIINTIQQHDPHEEAITFLLANGLSSKQILKIMSVYEENAISIISANPYQLVFDIDGIGFKTADKVAKYLNFEEDHKYRLEAYLLDRFKDISFSNGDSFVRYLDLREMAEELDDQQFRSAYASLIKREELIEDDGKIYHFTQHESEVFVSKFLSTFEFDGKVFELDNFSERIEQVERNLYIQFDDAQKSAIEKFLQEDVMILTGGPGTGKSTLLSGIVNLVQTAMPRMHITLCAPTGRAAKRLESLTNVQASTVHSVLNWNLEKNTFGMHEDNPLETDILIVDEFSMVDIWLFANLLKASTHVKKFLFVGDQDQLPSVGPGFVLGDLINSKRFEVIELKRNYRQEQGSEVIDLALNMNEGRFDISNYHKDVKFFDSRYGSVKDIVLRIVEEALNKGYNLNDIQVLAPMYDGPAGIDNLNHFLQKMCNPENPQKKEVVVGRRIFREGDKILQLKNQPDDFVFNGDIGILVEANPKQIVVDFDGNFVEYSPQDFINLSHAYAMSVHKAQGSEYPIIVLVAVKRFYRMLSRRLYYTGATRSSKSLILVGDYDAFEQAIEHASESKRNTYLIKRLNYFNRYKQ